MTITPSFTRVVMALVASSLASASVVKAQQKVDSGSTTTVAFVRVNVVPMNRELVLPDQTVVFQNGRILKVGPAAKTAIPSGGRKLDASGKYLIPGLADAHVHLQTPTEFSLYLANGVTTVFNLDGRPAHLLWRKKIAAGEMLGPTIFTTGPIFTQAHKPEEAVRMVDEQAELGYDAVKIYNGVSKEEYPALIAEAKKKHMLLMGHVPRGPDFEMTLAAGQSIAHLEEYTYTFFNPKHDNDDSHIVYDESRVPEAVQLTVKAGIYVTPTLSTYATIVQQATALDTFLKNTDLKYDPPWIQASLQPAANRYKNGFNTSEYSRIRTSLALQRKLVKALVDAKVPLMCGTDASDVGPVAGFGIHEELQELVNDGLTPYQALQTATVNLASYFSQTGEFGTIEPGKRADLVLLIGNPLQEISSTRKIAGVMVRGHWIESTELKASVEKVPSEYVDQIRMVKAQLENDPAAAESYLERNDPFDNVGAAALTELVEGQGADKLRQVIRGLRQKQSNSRLASEQAVNLLGYTLLQEKKYPEAIAVLRMNTEDFPKSANTWDSLAEILFKSGDMAGGVANYKKALEVDPDYPNADAAKKFVAEHESAK